MITQWLLKRLRLRQLFREMSWLAICAAAAVYLNGFPGGFQPFNPPFDWLLAREWLLLGLLAAFSLGAIVLGSIDWQGPVELRSGEGRSWSRSIRARLGFLVNVPVLLMISWGLFDFAQRTGFAGDWGRTAVAGFFCLDFLLMAGVGVMMALSARRLVSIEAEGVRFNGKLLPFSAVHRVRVRGDLKNRRVALVEADGVSWLDLEVIGVSARTFVEQLLAVAPGLQVDWPVRGEGEA